MPRRSRSRSARRGGRTAGMDVAGGSGNPRARHNGATARRTVQSRPRARRSAGRRARRRSMPDSEGRHERFVLRFRFASVTRCGKAASSNRPKRGGPARLRRPFVDPRVILWQTAARVACTPALLPLESCTCRAADTRVAERRPRSSSELSSHSAGRVRGRCSISFNGGLNTPASLRCGNSTSCHAEVEVCVIDSLLVRAALPQGRGDIR